MGQPVRAKGIGMEEISLGEKPIENDVVKDIG